MLRFLVFILSVFTILKATAQSVPVVRDTIRELDEVIIKAYAYNRPLIEIPASVAVVGQPDFQRFNISTLVPAMNTVPGVRFEERSPGSYRVSIRGSTLRSPFGVRNVKVYWNNIPLTDPGGNTYLNQLDPAMLGSLEILKGPGSSLYGAGTGGVLLLTSPYPEKGHALKAGLQIGSFGSEQFSVSYEEGKEQLSHQVQVMHQQAEGYRTHTRFSRDVVNSVFRFETNDNQVLETFIFYSDLFYETPGGLTLAEFTTNPRQARPATATLPGAEEQRAHVSLRSFYVGVSHEYAFTTELHNQTSVYGNLVNFKNPSIRNYDHRNEQSLGARSVTTYKYNMGNADITLLGGGEFQYGFLPVKSYENVQGKEGALLLDDETDVLQYSIFGQGALRWKKISATAGLSMNGLRYNFHRLSDVGSSPEQIRYDPEIMPRLAFIATPRKNISIYGSISRGFSPPTLAEINASNGVFNRDLQPETGTNYEMGARSIFFKTLKTDITFYSFGLKETIVIRREDDGAEYFINAGETKQKGIEFSLNFNPILAQGSLINKITLWSSYAFNHYRFGDYVKGLDDFSGNQLTGTPQHVFSGGVDVASRMGIYVRATILYASKLPLNDANTAYAEPYTLPGFRMGYQHKRFELYFGGDNLLNTNYSLGHDLNAVGGRYYNAAPARNFYGGIKVNLAF